MMQYNEYYYKKLYDYIMITFNRKSSAYVVVKKKQKSLNTTICYC